MTSLKYVNSFRRSEGPSIDSSDVNECDGDGVGRGARVATNSGTPTFVQPQTILYTIYVLTYQWGLVKRPLKLVRKLKQTRF